MEFTLDVDYVRRILREERQAAGDAAGTDGVLRALAQSHQRHDHRIASAPDAGSLACGVGCSWCCHFTIDVRAVEVFAILDHVEQHFDPAAKARTFAEVRANSATLAGLNDEERATRNVKCPFLDVGRCTIYTQRPQSCRNYHATDATGCQQSFEHPDNLDIDPEFAPGVYQAGAAHVEAFSAALQQGGFDVSVYEFNAALEAALSDSAARARFDAGLRPFSQLRGDDVPPEFDDLP